ncbi:6-phosphogluconolactonase [Salmonella enterica subsp. enterica]|uniref:6-phosphogluconolactonase n=1 Tax=Salmonella enterica I TaxID=59201 RepID=A0A447MVM1_SALET|nr:6-phosphogluconolactonase [Salmonella enterica subsp. enterica]
MKQTVYTASPESQQIHVWSLNHEGDADAGAGRGCARSGSADGGQSG